MTPIVSDIRILDNLLALNLNVSLWSARRKMSQEDLGGAELPPEDLASLGSKRIADPENLKVFGTLKARAFNYLDRHGVRFMNSKWTFIGGILTGIAGIFTAAAIAVELENGKSGSCDTVDESQRLALPEGEGQ